MSLKEKNGGPYIKQEQEKRRDEVFRLYFEYGYSALEISKMMKINRNTINKDVQFLFSKLNEEMDNKSIVDWMNKQLGRLESQRVRLREELDKDIALQERMQIEKILLDLDSRIASLIIKIDTSKQQNWDIVVKILNDWMKKHDKKDRYFSFGSLYRIPEKNRKQIFKLLKKE